MSMFFVDVDFSCPMATGGLMEVYRARFIEEIDPVTGFGPPHDQAVFKKFKPEVESKQAPRTRHSFFGNQSRASVEAAKIIESFVGEGIAPPHIKIRFHYSYEVDFGPCPEKYLVEPFVHDFEKFNSNTGWYRPDLCEMSDHHALMQALSHYSYHQSNGQYVLCDLQGGWNEDGTITLTNPTIHSHWRGIFGETDFGRLGQTAFLHHHVCNKYCQEHWLKPLDRKSLFDHLRRKGTSMISRNGIDAPLCVWLDYWNYDLDLLDRCQDYGDYLDAINDDDEDPPTFNFLEWRSARGFDAFEDELGPCQGP